MPTKFFANPNNKKILHDFVDKAGKTDPPSHIFTQLRLIINDIYRDPEEWDNRCKYNIKHNIAKDLIENIENYDFLIGVSAHMYETFALAYRLLYEYFFFINRRSDNPDNTLKGIRDSHFTQLLSGNLNWGEDNSDWTKSAEIQLKYALYVMPSDILREYLLSISIKDEENPIHLIHKERISNTQKRIEEWEISLDSKISIVETLQDKLEKQTAGFNFVGLYDGFKSLLKEKNKEIN